MWIVGKGDKTREVGRDKQGLEIYVKGVGFHPGGGKEPLKWGVQPFSLHFRKLNQAAVEKLIV